MALSTHQPFETVLIFAVSKLLNIVNYLSSGINNKNYDKKLLI